MVNSKSELLLFNMVSAKPWTNYVRVDAIPMGRARIITNLWDSRVRVASEKAGALIKSICHTQKNKNQGNLKHWGWQTEEPKGRRSGYPQKTKRHEPRMEETGYRKDLEPMAFQGQN